MGLCNGFGICLVVILSVVAKMQSSPHMPQSQSLKRKNDVILTVVINGKTGCLHLEWGVLPCIWPKKIIAVFQTLIQLILSFPRSLYIYINIHIKIKIDQNSSTCKEKRYERWRKNTFIWANDNNSLTWIVRPFWDDFPF